MVLNKNMLGRDRIRRIDRLAHELAHADMALEGRQESENSSLRHYLLRLSLGSVVTTEWGQKLPSPEVSFALLEALGEKIPAIGRLGLRLTVDEMYGCWALPLKAEYDELGRGRYPTISDSANSEKGTVAHRYVWRQVIDPNIPTEQHLDHLCRVHACCNLGHLEPVTQAHNIQRGNHDRHILSGQPTLSFEAEE